MELHLGKICKDVEACLFWTYVDTVDGSDTGPDSSNSCWLKNSNTGAATDYGHISGDVNCPKE